jgi:carnitine O-acetyltransferase
MTTQVRTFIHPQPLGQRLAESSSRPDTPRTIPAEPQLPKPTELLKRKPSYNRVPMDSHNGSKQSGGITFAAQDKLPKLPIPDLASSTKKYLEALKPLQTPREHGETQLAIEDFLKTDGPELQEKLKSYAQSKTSYIEQFCKSSREIRRYLLSFLT